MWGTASLGNWGNLGNLGELDASYALSIDANINVHNIAWSVILVPSDQLLRFDMS